MKNDKIKEFIKSKKGIAIIALIIGFTFGNAGSGSKDTQLTEANNQIKTLESTISKLNTEKNTLEGKVKEAEPFFAMKEEERLKVEADKKRAEKERKAKEAEETKKAKEALIASKTIKLSNGRYIAGEDFTDGIYTITAISGGGNVSSNNMYSGGINAVMGTANDDFYHLEYKNIKLPKGTELNIDGVTVKLTPKI